ncbi:MAG: lysophospholipid acyltransferase family protein [Myxococcota bacterium]
MSDRRSEEPRALRWARRIGTVGGVFLGLLLSLASAPLWIPGLALLDTIRRSDWVALRCGAYLTWLLVCEVVGLTCLLVLRIWPASSHDVWLDRHYALEHRWADALFGGGMRIFGLELEVEGAEAFRNGGPILLFIRHVTVVDALLPAMVASIPYGIRFRYVLKQELRIDPCLDITGDRLPSAFVRRGLPDGSAELARVVSLAEDLGPRDGVVIYPEGTRFTAARRARVLEKLETSGDMERLQAARSFEHVLPPRLGGVNGLIDAAPDADVVFCAHTGLERVTRLGDLFRGRAVGARLRVRCWRVSASQIPADLAARLKWLDAEWQRVDRFVGEHSAKT